MSKVINGQVFKMSNAKTSNELKSLQDIKVQWERKSKMKMSTVSRSMSKFHNKVVFIQDDIQKYYVLYDCIVLLTRIGTVKHLKTVLQV